MSDGYLPKDRAYLCKLQRERRASNPRIDYYPSREAVAAIDCKRGRYYPLNTNSGVLDAIVTEWAAMTGINDQQIEKPMTAGEGAGISPPFLAHTYESGSDWPTWADSWLAAGRLREVTARVTCGARRHRDGQPCRAKSMPGKRRCKWHGGCSTGPRTEEGKAKALANLRQNR
jgi:hypothetical protein